MGGRAGGGERGRGGGARPEMGHSAHLFFDHGQGQG